MKTGLLSKLLKGKKPPPGTTAVDQAVIAIVGLEQKYTAAVAAKDAARDRLQQAVAADILAGAEGDHGALEAALATAKAKVDAAARLVGEARKEAVALINAGRPARKARITELQAEVEKIKEAQTRRRVEAVAVLCHQWALTIRKWPAEQQAGIIDFPALGGLDRSELDEIFAKVAEKSPAADPDQTGLDALRTELERETLLDFYDTGTALDGLLAVARRAAC